MEIGYLVFQVKAPEFKGEYEALKARLLLSNLGGLLTRITGEQFIKENAKDFPNVEMRWKKLSIF
jgi:hypothetical protein